MNDIYVKKLIELKTEYRVKYKEIAKRLGVDNSFVSKMVSGQKLIPVKYYEQISRMLEQKKGGE